jgi:choline dehydrogenase-like flavoprotein
MTKRSLMLAGGGMKVAFQAGVLQVWLDEARLDFDHVDGASGRCLNLAMLCQGMSGTRIADNWRTLDPVVGVSLNWAQYERLFFARSIFTLDGYRERVFPKWGLDWQQIATSTHNATFNVYTIGIGGDLSLSWDVSRSKPLIDMIVNMHKLLSERTGGKPLVPPTWSLFKDLITPHPLGGCNMGTSAGDGVVDARGQVFGYPNLYVADGAIVPRPLGVNPSRTIGALAEYVAGSIVHPQ